MTLVANQLRKKTKLTPLQVCADADKAVTKLTGGSHVHTHLC